ncbi:alpha/beta-hydrolase [Choiromyces venosus 120613-1]|uniref:Alpha/beta-hydrolase n=1 Tax=Choiromyces venosus 120613-1 TaxID=1336337 RepID=A0A3N4JY58_9PEZI|nr:alpha/beta-hydrolase [Choiromyces venosus 120613-1]
MSYIIQQSSEMCKPIIGVSMNYGLSGFGFLFGQDVMGNTNLGLRDQRVALEWIQKNIKAFGGDPRKVTIWGAYSVGAHLLSYGGRGDGLYRAAIVESGRAVGPPWNDTRWYQPLYDRIFPALDVGLEWFTAIDGDYMRQWPVKAVLEKKFVKVPLLLGACTDEGTGFGVTGVNTDAQALAQSISSKRWVVTPYQAEKLLSLYPATGSSYGTGNRTFPELGLQFKRYSSMAGHFTMEAPRRLSAEIYSEAGADVYSYPWDGPIFNTSSRIGMLYVFSNPVQTFTPLGNDPSHLKLGHLIVRMSTSFTVELDPNGHEVKGIAKWPMYKTSKPQNFVFRNDTSYVEDGTYRKEGIAFINTILR